MQNANTLQGEKIRFFVTNTNIIIAMFRKTNFELIVDLFCSSGIRHSAVQGTPRTLSFTKSTAEEAGTCQ